MKSNLQYSGETALDRISTIKLPTLPAGTPFLLKSLTHENIDFVELATILEKFPSIAGKLISLANSAWSAPVTAVNSLEASCSRLGFGVVGSTSVALAVAAPFNTSRCPSFDPEYFWCSALLSAEAASRLAQYVATVGLAVKLVSAILREEPHFETDERLSRLGITGENFEGIFEQLTGQLANTRQIAKVLIG